MRIGFTGTRAGMTEAQKKALAQYLRELLGTESQFGARHEFHHGACVGSDEEAVEIAYPILVATYCAHPSNLEAYTSRKAIEASGIVHKPKAPLARDEDIVRESDFVIATPKGFAEEQRSGTWATVRMTRRADKPVVTIWPDGKVETA